MIDCRIALSSGTEVQAVSFTDRRAGRAPRKLAALGLSTGEQDRIEIVPNMFCFFGKLVSCNSRHVDFGYEYLDPFISC